MITITANEIYTILRDGGLSRAGALGMLGNMAAESGLKENIVQRGLSKLSGEQYTAAVDNGLLDFADGVGYGLAQWTFGQRKRNLLLYAKQCGVSVGNGVMQCQFALKELFEEYPALWQFLKETDSIDEASDRICKDFERPAVNNLLTRRDFAHSFEAETRENVVPYSPKDPVSSTFPPDPTIMGIQMWLWKNGYISEEEITGYKSQRFIEKLEEFLNDLKSEMRKYSL